MKKVFSSWSIVHRLLITCLLLLVSFLSIYYLPPTTFAADSNICCQKGTFLNPTDDMCYYPEDPDDPTGGDKLAGGPYTCTLPNQVCDNSFVPPQCFDKSIPPAERKISSGTGGNAGSDAVQKTPEDIFGTVPLPGAIANIPGLTGAAKLSSFLSTGIILLFLFGGTAFVFMIVFAAIRWITSGGDKEAVASARKRITWAIVGLILLSLAFLIIGLIGSITGFSLFQGNELIPGQQFQELENKAEEIRRTKAIQNSKALEAELRKKDRESQFCCSQDQVWKGNNCYDKEGNVVGNVTICSDGEYCDSFSSPPICNKL